MRGRAASLLLLLALAGCEEDGPGASPGPPTAGSPSPALSPAPPVRAVCEEVAAPVTVPPGASLAVLATEERELTLFLIEDLTGCWIRLDPSQAPLRTTALALHPSGRFLFASGEVAAGRIGVAAYGIVPERGALDGLGASWIDSPTDDFPGGLVATDRAVYMLSHGRHTGYHGGMWRWSFEPADGGLTWRGRAYDRARDSFFLEHGLDDRLVYLGTETIDDQGFGRVALAMAVGPGGALAPLAETRIDAPASAVADPSGTFVWLATGWTAGTTRLDAYRPEANGALGRPESADWQRPAPVVHPSGRVLYAASPTHVEAYAVDPVTGRPRLSARVAFAAADRLPLAVHPQGRFVYVAAPTEVHAFRAEADGRLEDYGRVAPGGTRLVTVRPQ